MADVLVGIFDRYEDAERVRTELVSEGFDPGRIAMSDTGWHVSHSGTAVPASDPDNLHGGTTFTGTMAGGSWTGSGPTATGGTGTTGDVTSEPGHLSLGQRIGGFFHRIFGDDDAPDEAHPYYEAVRRGSIAVTVELEDESQRAKAETVMARCGAVDIDARSESWRSHGWEGWNPDAPALTDEELRLERERHALSPGLAAGTTATGSALADEELAGSATARDRVTVPVVEESLEIGKREVSRGGLRVFTRVESVPVEQQVTLREEEAVLERRNVDRPATEADLSAARDATIEVRATGEEAVVAKTARVVEEVTVGKKATERTENVSDTVRRTRVEVKEDAPVARGTPGDTGRTGSGTGRLGTDDPDVAPGSTTRRPRGGGSGRS